MCNGYYSPSCSSSRNPPPITDIVNRCVIAIVVHNSELLNIIQQNILKIKYMIHQDVEKIQ